MAVYVEEEWQKYLPDLEIGDRVITKPRILTRYDLESFAILTGDPNPHILDEEIAKADGWKGQLAHGFLISSIGLGLLFQSGFIKKASVYMGTDKMKLLAPVYVNDSLRVDVEVLTKKQTRSGNWICSYKWLIKNQSDTAVAEGENT